MRHVPVLSKEVIDALQLTPGLHVVDCTLGDAGHSEAILERTNPDGKLLGIDADPESILRSKQYLYRFSDRTIFVRDNFVHLKQIVAENRFEPVQAIVMDLGWSSPQFAERGRGFSFETDEPLDMRFEGQSKSQVITAAQIVNTYAQDELARVFKMYGEEPLSKEIAQAIVKKRKEKLFETTKELVDLILELYRIKLHSIKEIPWIGGIHPATKVFQALRIETNQELEVLRQALPQAIETLATQGRLAVISFHSLEDRIVKHYFQSIENKKIRLVNKKPITAGEEELKTNPRARSAKLRVVEKM